MMINYTKQKQEVIKNKLSSLQRQSEATLKQYQEIYFNILEQEEFFEIKQKMEEVTILFQECIEELLLQKEYIHKSILIYDETQKEIQNKINQLYSCIINKI